RCCLCFVKPTDTILMKKSPTTLDRTNLSVRDGRNAALLSPAGGASSDAFLPAAPALPGAFEPYVPAPARRNPFRFLWSSRLTLFACLILLLFLSFAIFADWIAPYPFDEI